MRIAVDARPALDPRRTGVGHYARRLIEHLPAAMPDDEVTAWYLHPRGPFSKHRFFEGTGATEHASRVPTRVFQPAAWRLGVPRLEWLVGFDVLLATNFMPPPTKRSCVVLVVHDLAYEVMPETAPHHGAAWRRRFDAWLRQSAAVIVPSVSARADLLDRHEVDDGHVYVVAHGAETFEAPTPAAVEAARERFDIGGRYVLFVGGIEPRKNLHGLVEAFRRVDTDAWLVVAGGQTRWSPGETGRLEIAVARLGEAARRRVRFTGYVSEDHKRALLAGAEVLAYPSRYEGFGFPVLEGFAAGVPVLTSTASSLPEVAGEAALLVDPTDPGEIASGLDRLLSDEDLRRRLRDAGRQRVRGFTWERSAASTAEVLRAAARG